ANVIVSAKNDSASPNHPSTPRLDDEIPLFNEGSEVTRVALLYLLVGARRYGQAADSGKPTPVVLAGLEGKNVQRVLPAEILEVIPYPASTIHDPVPTFDETKAVGAGGNCRVGRKVAATLQVHAGDQIELINRTNHMTCFVTTVEEFGGPEDNQIL